jgi:hypothetical protein
MNEGTKIYTSRNKNEHHTKKSGNKNLVDQIFMNEGTKIYTFGNKSKHHL